MLNRKFRLKFDLSNYNVFDVPEIFFCLMDTNSSMLYVELLNEGEKIDLTGMRMVLYVSKPDGTEVTIECLNEDMTNGLVKFILPKQALSLASSNYNAEVRVIQDGRCVVTRPFNYSVFENLSSSDQQMVSSNEYVLLVDSLKRLSDIEINEDLRIKNEKDRIIQAKAFNDDEVIRKKNELDRIAAEADRVKIFNSLAPEQATNVEVQLARRDIEGFIHDSLKDRLDKIETQPSIIYETIEG